MHEHDGLAAIEFRSTMGTQPRQRRYARRTDSGALDLMALLLIEAEAREQPLTAAAAERHGGASGIPRAPLAGS